MRRPPSPFRPLVLAPAALVLLAGGTRLAVFDPRTERFREHPLPIPDALPYVVEVDAARNRVWIGTGAADAVLSFDPRSEGFSVYPRPTPGALLRHIAVDPATGDLWAAYGASPGIPPKIARARPRGCRGSSRSRSGARDRSPCPPRRPVRSDSRRGRALFTNCLRPGCSAGGGRP